MIEIIPSILTDDPVEFWELLKRCEGITERVQIDVIDGEFADNKTVDISILENYDGNLKFDYHLMVKEPINWVEKCVRGGADRIIGQIEMMSSQVDFLAKVQGIGAKVGLGLDIKTRVSKLDPVILTDLDVVLAMSVEAGFGGQKFDKSVLNKLKELDEIRVRDNSPYRIQDDGGVTLERIDDTHFEGADEVTIGRKLFDGDLSENINRFQEAAHGMGNSK
jgi:ribulose-phosphate 3-epimerase